MKILSMDTSGLVASVALLQDGQILAEYTTQYKKNHSITLMPMIDQMCTCVELDLKTLDLIAVSGGPGSFTGLRIGSATAKGLAQALNLPIASIPTLEVLANNIGPTDRVICPLMDARRSQVYTALYRYTDGKLCPVTQMLAVEIKEILEKIKALGEPVIFLGDGYAPNIRIIEEELEGFPYEIAPPQHNLQRAAITAVLGMRYAQQGLLENYMDHAPIYLRKSQAEREYDEKHSEKE